MSLSLPSFVSLFSLLVSAVLGWSVVFRHVCVYVKCTQLSACLPVFVHLCFYFVIKNPISLHLSPRLISLCTHPDRMDQPNEDSAEGATGKMGSGGSFSMSARETGTLRFTPETLWEWLASRLRKRPASCFFFLGGLAEPFKSRMPYWHPKESLEEYVKLALHLSGSAFRVELAPEPAPFRELTESAPEPAPFREPTESAPEPAPFREPTESAPETAPFREPTESVPETAPFREPTEPSPFREPTESPPEPAPFRELTESAPEPAPFHSMSPQSPLRSVSPQSPPQSPLRSVSPRSPLSSVSPRSPLRSLSPLRSGSP